MRKVEGTAVNTDKVLLTCLCVTSYSVGWVITGPEVIGYRLLSYSICLLSPGCLHSVYTSECESNLTFCFVTIQFSLFECFLPIYG